MRIIFMGTPDFACPCLEALIADKQEIVAIVTQPDRPKGRGKQLAYSPVKECALPHGFPILQPEKVRQENWVSVLRKLRPDLIIVVAFGQILPTAVLEIPSYGCINIHASLLPKYRGASPIHHAVLNGDTVTGITSMQMAAGLDTGDILLQKKIAIGSEETTGELHDRLKNLGAEVLLETIHALIADTLLPQPQRNEEASYVAMIKKQDGKIDFNHLASKVHNQIRGLNPWPGCFAYQENVPLKIWSSRLISEEEDFSVPGLITHINQEGIYVNCRQGRLLLLEVQPPNKRRMNASEYARGYHLQVGDILE